MRRVVVATWFVVYVWTRPWALVEVSVVEIVVGTIWSEYEVTVPSCEEAATTDVRAEVAAVLVPVAAFVDLVDVAAWMVDLMLEAVETMDFVTTLRVEEAIFKLVHEMVFDNA